jgi:DNA-directed RNA polymerase subunit alpha
MLQLFKTKMTQFILPHRLINLLTIQGIYTLGELVSLQESEIMKFRNLGLKSMKLLKKLIKSKGLCFGYDIEKHNYTANFKMQ